MHWKCLIGLVVFTFSSISAKERQDLAPLLRRHLNETKFPAIAAAVVQGSNIIAAGAVGVRKVNAADEVALDDKFHIGSCTKSITALLAVHLDRDDIIKLTNQVGRVLTNWNLPEWIQSVSLQELLQNRGGISEKPPQAAWERAFDRANTKPQEQRKQFLIEALQESSAATPGTKFIYSNTGYALAGAMIETSAGETWEELVRKRIFEPLDLRSAGFGPPTRDENIDQPWGHSWIDNRAQAVPPTDNPLAIAPGGGVHMSILDLARYAAFHLAATQGKVASLRPFQTALYEPPENSAYALGWKVEKHDWAGGNALTHAGSNTYFFAVIWIAPARDFACVVATNIGDHGNIVAMKCDLVVADLIKQFIP